MPAAPSVDEHTVTFHFDDPDRRLSGVRLRQEVGIPGEALEFAYQEEARSWLLRLPRPAVWRMEYLFELRHPDGGTETVRDPANPLTAPGAFGSKSVAEFPEYREPGWLRLTDAELAAGEWREVGSYADALGTEVAARVWSPETPTDHLLIAHDGPEYDSLASIGRYTRAMIGTGRVPPFHLALLAPGERSRWYAADPSYSRALTRQVIPALRRTLGTTGPVVGAGASLGALSLLHAQRRHPGVFAGLFLQSGSFFVPAHDRHESGFSGYRRIVRFVLPVLRSGGWPDPVPTVLTCGQVEENVHNNRMMAAALVDQGYPAALHEVPDAHNYVGWRDAFDPHLTELLATVWAGRSTPGRSTPGRSTPGWSTAGQSTG